MSACPSCGAEIPAALVSMQLDAARCPRCGALVDLRAGFEPGRRRETVGAPRPERWTCEQGGEGLVIRWRWFTAASLVMIPFTMIWNGILVAMSFGVTDGWRHPERALAGLVVPHVWVGIGLVYWTIAQFMNSTTITAGGGRLVVKKGPVPWPGNQDLPSSDVQQLFVVEKPGRNRHTFQLCAVLRDGRNRVLVDGLDDLPAARFLEARLEQRLAIDDRPVDGEVPR